MHLVTTIMHTMPYDSTETLDFGRQKSRRNCKGVTSTGTPIFGQYLAISQKRCKIET